MQHYMSLLLGILLASCGLPAHAQEPVGSAADQAFLEGVSHADAEQYAQAIDAFWRAFLLKPHPLTKFNIGLCERKILRYTRARTALLDALSDVRRLGDKEREARLALASVEKEIGRIEVMISPADAELRVDGSPVVADPHADRAGLLLAGTLPKGPARPLPGPSFTLLVNPGVHLFELSRTGFVSRDGKPVSSVTVITTQGSRSRMSIMMVPKSAPPKAQIPVAGIVTVGLGAVGLVTGSLLGGMALTKGSDADEHCAGTLCDARGLELADQSKSWAIAADVALATGLLATGIGVGLIVTAQPSAEAPSSSTGQGGAKGIDGATLGIGGVW